MSEQAQASSTIGVSEAQTDRYAAAREALPAGAQDGPESAGEGRGAEAAARESARLQEEADARLATEREASEREAAEQEAARVRALVGVHRGHMDTASAHFADVASALAEISATLTWEPARSGDVGRAIAKAAHGLGGLRDSLAAAASLGAEPHLQVQEVDLGAAYGFALDANRELRRRIDSFIAVMSTDVFNTVALKAVDRTISEQGLIAGVANGGLCRLLAREGVAQ